MGQLQIEFLAGVLAAISGGIFLARETAPPLLPLTAGWLACLALGLVLTRRRHGKTWIVLLILCFLTGMLRFVTGNELPSTDVSHFAGRRATVVGRIVEEPRVAETADGSFKLRYRIAVKKIAEGGEREACGEMYIYSRAAAGQVPQGRIGDTARARGEVRIPRGYQNPGQIDTEMLLRSQGITAQMVAGKEGVHVDPGEERPFLGRLAEIRASYRESMESVMPKTDAAAIFAMLFGGYDGLKPELVEAFSATGIVHILSVSGSHVSLLAAVTAWMGSFLGCSRPLQAVMVTAVIVVYCLLAGCVPPVIRAGIMGGLAFLALALGREGDGRRILLLTGAGMLLFSPLLLFHISFQLSFAATAGLLFVAPSLRCRMLERKFPEFAAGSLAVTIGAQAFALPFLAWYFNRLSLSSLLANLLVVPVVEGMIVLGLFAGLLAWLLPFLGKLLFLLDSLFLGAVYEMTRWMAKLPGSQIYLPTVGFGGGGIFYGLLIYGLQSRERKAVIRERLRPYRRAILRIMAAALLFYAGWRWSCPREVMVAFIDVGQGDAMMVKTVHGHAVMFDTGGTRDGGFDVGSRVDVPYLLHYGVTKLDYIFLSHAHEDHAAGTGGILKHLPVGAVVTAGEGREEYRRSMRISPEEMAKTTFTEALEGEVFEVDGVRIEVLYAPVSEKKGTGNEVSNVYRVSYGKASFLVTGDLVKEEEAKLLKKHPDIRCTVLKCGHHGSRTSTSDEFLRAADPQWAVFCVGRDNTFGHPHRETVEKVEKAGVRICRTDEDGAVAFYTDGQRIRVEKFRN